MEIIACQCPEGFGIPHTHVPQKFRFRRKNSEIEVSFDAMTCSMNRRSLFEDWDEIGVEPEHIVICVDWKAVARALSVV